MYKLEVVVCIFQCSIVRTNSDIFRGLNLEAMLPLVSVYLPLIYTPHLRYVYCNTRNRFIDLRVKCCCFVGEISRVIYFIYFFSFWVIIGLCFS